MDDKELFSLTAKYSGLFSNSSVKPFDNFIST